MSNITATYSPEDNKLRLYSTTRLDSETYNRVIKAGFKWAPKQELFVTHMWTPTREDLCIELAGEIGDEDTTLVERAEAKAERLEDLSERRTQDADRAQKAVHAIADGIPFGQPILVGHHSERHARKDAEKIENGMRKAVECWKAAQYWQDRAKGAIRLAKYKERSDVRARRIKGLEADKRKEERSQTDAQKFLKAYEDPQARTAKMRDGRDLLPALLQTWEGGLSYENQTRLTNEELPFDEALNMATSAKRATVANTQRWITAPSPDLKLANRELGTVEGIGHDGRMSLKMDGGREVELDSVKNPHLDHGYAVTSHSSQGQTADRVLIHADTELGAKDLLNNRMAYVAVSRGAYDAQIFINDREKLGAALGHDVSHSSAHAPEMKPEQKQEQAITPQQEIAPKQEQGEDFGLGL
jgi:hypothetical protein